MINIHEFQLNITKLGVNETLSRMLIQHGEFSSLKLPDEWHDDKNGHTYLRFGNNFKYYPVLSKGGVKVLSMNLLIQKYISF